MAIKPWKTLDAKVVAETPLFELERITRASEAGRTGDFYVVKIQDWVNVFVFTPEDELVLIEQYRHGTDEVTLEVPGGAIDDGESPLEAAARELREETGFTCESWEIVGCVEPNPAIQNNRCWTLVGRGARKTHATDMDEHEEIEVKLVPRGQMDSLIKDRTIKHSLVVAGWYFAR